ncbi:hypothetical protein C8R46DRAFT_1353810 [Mycena filopes]|nr:hypothetical protein C8R46DRAFT_1353810 [Mycena filopes]
MPTELTRLPLELLDNIASQAAESDLLALCRTNRGLYDVCLQWIYHTIGPSTLSLVVILLKTLASNKRAAACVRFIGITIPSHEILQSFGRLMRSAFVNLTFLQDFQFSSSALFHTISSIHFPCLKECLVPLCPQTADFIRMHPTLVELSILPNQDALPVPLRPAFSHLSLPALKSFNGSESLACEILRGARVTLVTISWEVHLEHEYKSVLSELSKVSTPSLRVMRNLMRGWEADLFPPIAEHLPHLTALGFCDLSLLPPAEGTLQDFYSTVTSHISAFPSLTSISIISHFQHTVPSPADIALEFEFVRTWGARAHSLLACSLTSDTVWLRGAPGDPVWFPFARSDGDGPADTNSESKWRHKWVVSTVVRAPTVYPEYMKSLEQRSGKDPLELLKAAIRRGDVI